MAIPRGKSEEPSFHFLSFLLSLLVHLLILPIFIYFDVAVGIERSKMWLWKFMLSIFFIWNSMRKFWQTNIKSLHDSFLCMHVYRYLVMLLLRWTKMVHICPVYLCLCTCEQLLSNAEYDPKIYTIFSYLHSSNILGVYLWSTSAKHYKMTERKTEKTRRVKKRMNGIVKISRKARDANKQVLTVENLKD